MFGTFLGWIALFVGRVLKYILPEIMKQGREPRKVEMLGNDDAIKSEIDQSVADGLARSTSTSSKG